MNPDSLATEGVAIVRAALDIERASAEARALVREIREGEEVIQRATKLTEDRRYKLALLLVEVRKTIPTSGPKAKVWGEFCEGCGLTRQTASNYMELVAHVAANPEAGERPVIDAYRDTGIKEVRQTGLANPKEPPLLPCAEESDPPADRRQGRPALPEHERRTEIIFVRVNDEELRRLQRLSGSLQILTYADVLREGLLALEEREAKKGR